MGGLLGIDLGGTALKVVTTDGCAVTSEQTLSTPSGGPKTILNALTAVIDEHSGDGPVGLAVPGKYDRTSDRVLLLPNIDGDWREVGLAGTLSSLTGRRVVICNDARAFALAELRTGAARGLENVLFVAFGTGIGGAVAIDGRLALGWHERAGEIGHTSIDSSGPVCKCGSRGCLELYASATALVANTRRFLQGVTGSTLQGVDPEELTAQLVFSSAMNGDRVAQAVVNELAFALGRGLAPAVTLLAPEAIVIGGAGAASIVKWSDRIQSAIAQYARFPSCPRVLSATKGAHAGALGAALWALELPHLHSHTTVSEPLAAHVSPRRGKLGLL